MPSYMQYKRQIAVLDADNSEIESWITVRGNHIPIMKGQSKEEAVKSFIEHQAGKNDTPQGVKWTPTNKKGEGTGNVKKEEKPKYNIQHGAKLQDIESMINKHADKKGYKSWKEEEEYVAEKLKQEGIYAYGSQIKEAMKNVYGDAYTKERNGGKYDPEFETVRKNALANPYLYNLRYTQKSKAEAYKEYKNDKESAGVPEDYKKSVAHYSPEKHAEAANFYGEKMASVQKKANSQTDPNASVYAKQFKEYQDLAHWHEEQSKKSTEKPKNTFLSNQNTLKEFAGHFGISESVAKAASEKFGDSFYNLMTKDPKAGVGIATNYKDYTKEDIEKHLKDIEKKSKNDISNNKKSTKKKKEPAIVREGNVNWVDPKEWNSPENDPWYALYE